MDSPNLYTLHRWHRNLEKTDFCNFYESGCNAERDDELVLYLTYQSCHHSGGHRRTREQSCTLKLIDFHRTWFMSRGVRMHIKICYLYRAHWRGMAEFGYGPMIENAQAGIRLLMAEGIALNAMVPSDCH
jgi:hypothetical protein